MTCQEQIAARIADGEVIDEFQEAGPMTLVDLRKLAIRKQFKIRFRCATAWSA